MNPPRTLNQPNWLNNPPRFCDFWSFSYTPNVLCILNDLFGVLININPTYNPHQSIRILFVATLFLIINRIHWISFRITYQWFIFILFGLCGIFMWIVQIFSITCIHLARVPFSISLRFFHLEKLLTQN